VFETCNVRENEPTMSQNKHDEHQSQASVATQLPDDAPNDAIRKARRARIARQRAQMESLTWEIFVFVRDYLAEHQHAPTVREIADGVFVASSTPYRHLDKLVGMGWLHREMGIPRSIVLGENAPDDISPDDDDVL
jgi:sulfur relay (sulfurtransferase) DsrC/TusE family protein